MTLKLIPSPGSIREAHPEGMLHGGSSKNCSKTIFLVGTQHSGDLSSAPQNPYVQTP